MYVKKECLNNRNNDVLVQNIAITSQIYPARNQDNLSLHTLSERHKKTLDHTDNVIHNKMHWQKKHLKNYF